MNYIQRMLLRSRIKKVIRGTYDNPPALSFLSTVEIFRKLPPDVLLRVWKYEYAPRCFYGDSLDTVLNSYAADGVIRKYPKVSPDEPEMADPLEWLTGNNRTRVIELLSNPETRALGELSTTIWYTLVKSDFRYMTIDQIQSLDVAIRRVLKGVTTCL